MKRFAIKASIAVGLGLGLTLALLWLLGGSGSLVIQALGPVPCTCPGLTGTGQVRPKPLVSLILGLEDPGLWPKPLVLCPRDKGDRGYRAQGPDGHSVYYVALSCTAVPTPCYTTVQAAVDAADDPDDVIKVAAGTYAGVSARAGVTQAVYISKTVMVRGGYTMTNWTMPDLESNPTTLDAQGQGRVLYITGDISPTIEGLRITGGDAAGLGGSGSGDTGGGVYIITATAIISNNEVFSNTAAKSGGLYLFKSNATLNGNTIISNTADFVGGLLLSGGDVTLSGNTIAANTSRSASGGGLYLHWSNAMLSGNTISSNTANNRRGGGLVLKDSDATLNGNTIISNTANDGGGLCLWSSDAELVNNVVADNQANNVGAGISVLHASAPRLWHTTIARNGGGNGHGVYVADGATVWMTNTILVSHTVGITVTDGSTATLTATLWGSGAWANEDDWGGDGTVITGAVNLRGDPAFVDPNTGDYHVDLTSAAIDNGVDAGVGDDIDGDPRPQGDGYDLGADETGLVVTKQASPDPVQADEQLTYTICVTNTSGVTLTATITDVLPNHVTPTGVLTWTPTITVPGDVWTETVFVTVEAGYAGPLTNVVRVTTEEGAAGVYTETALSLVPHLEVSKQADPDPVEAGAQLTYTIRVTNTGNVTLTATITDVLPNHVTLSGVLTWTPTITAPGGVWTETVFVTVEMSYLGLLTNVVRVTTDEGATGVYTATTEVPVTPRLEVSKQADPDPVLAGAQLTYTIRVTNTGNVDLNVIIFDTLPSHVTPGDILFWTPAPIALGGVWTETVVVTVDRDYAGRLSNIVYVSDGEGLSWGCSAISRATTGYDVHLPLVLKNR